MEGGRIVQVGTPEDILQNPADDYVRAFFRGVDPTNVISAGDIVRDTHPTIIKSKVGSLRATHELLSGSERDHCYVLDARKRFLGIVSSESLREALEGGLPDSPVDQVFLDDGVSVNLNDSMQDILPVVASKSWPVPVVDDQNVFKGVVSKNRFLRTLHRAEESMEDLMTVSGIEGAVSDPIKIGWVVSDIRIVANKKFIAKNPAAKKFFEVFTLPLADINEQNTRMYEGEKSQEDITRHVDEWIAKNQDNWKGWLKEARKAAK